MTRSTVSVEIWSLIATANAQTHWTSAKETLVLQQEAFRRTHAQGACGTSSRDRQSVNFDYRASSDIRRAHSPYLTSKLDI